MPVAVVKDGLSVPPTPIGEGRGIAQILGNDSEEAPLHCGFSYVEAGATSEVTYDFTLFTLLLEGELTFEDKAKPGEVITLKPMDIVCGNKGDSGTFRTATGAKSFYVVQRPKGTDPKPYVK